MLSKPAFLPKLLAEAAAIFLAFFLLPGLTAARAERVDVALVLAIDTSSSINDAEYILQTGGTAAAVTDPSVAAALLSGPRGTAAIAFVLWGDPMAPRVASRWHIISTPRDLVQFAAELKTTKARPKGSTGLGAGLGHAVGLFQSAPFAADRKVIDVSGDGRDTVFPRRKAGTDMQSVRALAHRLGITINCLAMPKAESGLSQYYRENVTAGAGSFVVTVEDNGDFSEAMRLKIIRETQYEPLVSALSP
jgi:hypothetical protein